MTYKYEKIAWVIKCGDKYLGIPWRDSERHESMFVDDYKDAYMFHYASEGVGIGNINEYIKKYNLPCATAIRVVISYVGSEL